ncbi:unnamed protein product [Pleuronectes platessa]|uniref:Uncharacterized protein n=1 Tax=Pleuronectes platessa TaxID=8262 RepID=A0A9N7Z9I0_PLEPL|nr:unnamed protein product [Pleuronectes platessa]
MECMLPTTAASQLSSITSQTTPSCDVTAAVVIETEATGLTGFTSLCNGHVQWTPADAVQSRVKTTEKNPGQNREGHHRRQLCELKGACMDELLYDPPPPSLLLSPSLPLSLSPSLPPSLPPLYGPPLILDRMSSWRQADGRRRDTRDKVRDGLQEKDRGRGEEGTSRRKTEE